MSDEVKIKLTTTGDPAGANTVATSLKGVGKAAEDAAGGSSKLDKSGKEATSTIEALGKKGSAAKDVYEGLNQTMTGGVGAVFGMSKAWANLTESIKANPVGTALAITLAALGLIKKGFDYLADSTEEANKKLFGTGEKSAAAAAKIEALGKTATEAANALKATATTAAEEWERLGRAMDYAQKRSDALANAQMANDIAQIDAQEQDDLAHSKPADREAVKRYHDRRRTAVRADYAVRALDSADLQADVQKRNAQQEIFNARERIAPYEVQAALKSGALAEAEQQGKTAIASRNPDMMAEASLRVLTARTESELAQKNLDAARKAEEATRRTAQDRITNANDTVEINRIKRGTAGLTRVAQVDAEAATETAGFEKEETGRVARDSLRVAGIAKGMPVANVYKEDYGKSGDRRKAEREKVEADNAARRLLLDTSVENIEKIGKKIEGGSAESGDLAKLAEAVASLAEATQNTGNATIKALTRRISNLESQLKNNR